jgi:hypothetical protein
MYKPFTNQNLLFSENCFDVINNVQHYCDDIFFIRQYSKDRTFNEIRRDVYFQSQSFQISSYGILPNFKLQPKYYANKHNSLRLYTLDRNKLKNLNKQVHDLFRSGKKIYISTILKDFDIMTINKSKKCFKIELTRGCFIYKTGNQTCFVAENSDYYYTIHWIGS